MSNAEEVLRSKLKSRFGTASPYKDIADWALTDFIAEVMQAHTNQTLQELKEWVKKKSVYFPSTGSKFLTENDIITLIDEAINE